MQNQATMGGSDLATPVQAIALSYNNQQTGPCMRPSCRRVTTNVFPNTNITSTMSNRVLRFGVSAEGFLDGKSSYLAFDLQGTTVANAATQPYFNPTTDSFFHRISIYSNSGVLIEDLQNQELLGCILLRDTSADYLASIGTASLGENESFSAAGRYQQYITKNRYVCELRGSGFLNAFNYVPLKALGNTQSNAFFLEVEFAPANRMITQGVGGTDAGYTISNVVYVADIVYDDVKEAEIQNMLTMSPIVFHFQTWKSHDNTIQTGSTNNTITVSEFQESLEEIAVVFKNNTTLNDINYPLWQFDMPNATDTINNIQLKIGNYMYPAQQLFQNTGIAQQYYEYAKAQQKQRKYYDGNKALSHNNATGKTSAETTDYIFRYPLRIMPTDANGETIDYFFGVNTRVNPQSINILLNTSALANTYTVQSYVKFDVSLVIMKNESYVVS
jgi:hypothetical protein